MKLPGLFVFASMAIVANGATIQVPFSLGFSTADGSTQFVNIAQFDPALGTLTSVQISVDANTTGGSVAYTAGTPGDRTLRIGAEVTVTAPVSIVLTPNPLETASFSGLTASQSVSLNGVGGSDSESLSRTAPPFDLSPYIGLGTFSMTVKGDSDTGSSGSSTGSTVDVAPQYAVNGMVTYFYTIPEPSSAILGLAAVAGFGLVRRRR